MIFFARILPYLSYLMHPDADQSGTIGFNKVSIPESFTRLPDIDIESTLSFLVYGSILGFVAQTSCIARKDKRSLSTKPQYWHGVFPYFDRDRSGTIDGHELQAALNHFGYRLSPNLLTRLQCAMQIWYASLSHALSCSRSLSSDAKGSSPAHGWLSTCFARNQVQSIRACMRGRGENY